MKSILNKLLLSLLLFSSLSMAGVQDDRQALIQKLIARGVFEKVETPGNLPHLWVTPLFNSLDFKTKSSFASVVYAYYNTQNPKYNILAIYDNRTGKKIGAYAPEYNGLKLD